MYVCLLPWLSIVLLIKCTKTQNIYAITQLNSSVGIYHWKQIDSTETFNCCYVTEVWTFLLYVFDFWQHEHLKSLYSNQSLCGETLSYSMASITVNHFIFFIIL